MKFLILSLFLIFTSIGNAQTYIQGNNLIEVPVVTATAAGTTTFTSATKKNQEFTGTTTQTVVLPDATTLQLGRSFYLMNRSTGTVTVNYSDSSLAVSMTAGTQAFLIVMSNSTTVGVWDIGFTTSGGSGSGTVTSTSVVSANGFAGTVANSTTTPAITLSTSITGLLKGNGTAISSASSGTDYVVPGGNVATATALASNPTDCSTNQFATAIDASANLTCAQVAFSNLSGNLATSQLPTALTWASSGTVPAYTPSAHGLVISGSGAAATVLAPDASTTKVLTSGGSSADPSWQAAGTASPLTTNGDIYYYNSTNARLPVGSTNNVLTVNSGLPSWQPAQVVSPLSNKGDIYTFTTVNALHSGASNYAHMIGDSAQADGWRNVDTHTVDGALGKNYIQYADFENNATTGWTAIGCATITNGLPACNGTGGGAFTSSNGGRAKNANTNAPAIDSGISIGGTYALNLATTGAGAIGDGYATSFYVEVGDAGKVMSFKIYYKVAAGTAVLAGTSANTYAVAIYDQSNNSWIAPTGAFNFIQSSGVGIATGTFQTAFSTSQQQYQLFVYSPVAPTATSSLLIDDVYVGPQTVSMGPAMNDWVSYTPAISWVANATATGKWRRVGDTMEAIVTVNTSGATTATQLTVTLPSGYSVDFTKLSSTPTAANPITVGYGQCAPTGTTGFAAYPYLTTSTTVIPIAVTSSLSTFTGTQFPSEAGLTNTIPASFGASGFVEVIIRVPIIGWSSNSVMSSDTDTRVVALNATASTAASMGTLTTSYSNTIFNTVGAGQDSYGAYNATTGVYTIPVTGFYDIASSIVTGGTAALNTSLTLQLWNASTSASIIEQASVSGGAEANIIVPLTVNGLLFTAGTQIQMRAKFTGTYTLGAYVTNTVQNYFSVSRRSGPSVITATESVEAFYTTSVTAPLTSTATTASFTAKVYDTHNACSSGVCTAPVSGKYTTTCEIEWPTANTTGGREVDVLYNGVTLACPNILALSLNSTSAQRSYCSVTVPLLAGQTVACQGYQNSGSTLTLTGTATGNWMMFTRVGN